MLNADSSRLLIWFLLTQFHRLILQDSRIMTHFNLENYQPNYLSFPQGHHLYHQIPLLTTPWSQTRKISVLINILILLPFKRSWTTVTRTNCFWTDDTKNVITSHDPVVSLTVGTLNQASLLLEARHRKLTAHPHTWFFRVCWPW